MKPNSNSNVWPKKQYNIISFFIFSIPLPSGFPDKGKNEVQEGAGL
jgi:hypothetical protein